MGGGGRALRRYKHMMLDCCKWAEVWKWMTCVYLQYTDVCGKCSRIRSDNGWIKRKCHWCARVNIWQWYDSLQKDVTMHSTETINEVRQIMAGRTRKRPKQQDAETREGPNNSEQWRISIKYKGSKKRGSRTHSTTTTTTICNLFSISMVLNSIRFRTFRIK